VFNRGPQAVRGGGREAPRHAGGSSLGAMHPKIALTPQVFEIQKRQPERCLRPVFKIHSIAAALQLSLTATT
jgi:hypothetical protein